MSEETGPDGPEAAKSQLRRTIDVCVAAPVGVAVSVVEELPELIAEGRRRLEMQLGNALFVGRFVVNKKQRELSERLEGLLGNGSSPEAPDGDSGPPETPTAPRPAPDPAAAAVVGRALADYDTLSASQVVRRLESLGPEELQAVQRYEASTRNRRTILNRAGQLLDERPHGPTGS